MKTLKHLFDKNNEWATSITKQNPDFFTELSEQQSPDYFWIGCSDSRVPANQIVNLQPGEVFVHRNIANLVVHSDLNCLSVLQYAVEKLKVKHIIVCGHYDCGGIKAALANNDNGLVDNWLRHIKDVYRFNADKLDRLPAKEKLDLLCELNVIEQVRNVCNSTIVKNAWKEGSPLSIHGWIYGMTDGIIKDLDMTISSTAEFKEKKKSL